MFSHLAAKISFLVEDKLSQCVKSIEQFFSRQNRQFDFEMTHFIEHSTMKIQEIATLFVKSLIKKVVEKTVASIFKSIVHSVTKKKILQCFYTLWQFLALWRRKVSSFCHLLYRKLGRNIFVIKWTMHFKDKAFKLENERFQACRYCNDFFLQNYNSFDI